MVQRNIEQQMADARRAMAEESMRRGLDPDDSPAVMSAGWTVVASLAQGLTGPLEVATGSAVTARQWLAVLFAVCARACDDDAEDAAG